MWEEEAAWLTALSKNIGRLSLTICKEGWEQMTVLEGRETYDITEEKYLGKREKVREGGMEISGRWTYDEDPVSTSLKERENWNGRWVREKRA